jgi:hypothetical protein
LQFEVSWNKEVREFNCIFIRDLVGESKNLAKRLVSAYELDLGEMAAIAPMKYNNFDTLPS